MNFMQNARKGFTLIELLVVITIIGILATGGVTYYTTQIQKARDATRINDVDVLKGGVEQYYQDQTKYPSLGAAFSGVSVYTPKLPKDPKSKESTANTSFEYAYNVKMDGNGIPAQQYEVSTTFEAQGQIDSKAKLDNGDDNFRLELGINTPGIKTLIKGVQAPAVVGTYVCVTSNTNTATTCADDGDNPMIING